MKIALGEIWNFLDLIRQGEPGWRFSLHAGKFVIENATYETLQSIKNDTKYDTEILPEIFTFREILWQPDVFTEAAKSLPGLRILAAFCEESSQHFREIETEVGVIYARLIEGIGQCCQEAVAKIEKKKNSETTQVLGGFRRDAFPIIKFFIFHPQNRPDYYRDAVNRLNYAVKVMLTEFHGRYTELKDPYWKVQFQPESKKQKTDTPGPETPSEEEGNT